jgi:hypothetical protein
MEQLIRVFGNARHERVQLQVKDIQGIQQPKLALLFLILSYWVKVVTYDYPKDRMTAQYIDMTMFKTL